MTTQTSNKPPTASPKAAIAAIIAISIAASLFLFWLIYIHPAADVSGTKYAFLPALNAILNGLSAIALLIGYTFIRARRVAAHRASMFTAFVFSSLFLVAYITNYALHGEMVFPKAAGAIRWVYFPLLISHIVLAVVVLPMILITFFLSLSGRFPAHRRLARWTFPIWLYVSVTGVIVYLMLATYH